MTSRLATLGKLALILIFYGPLFGAVGLAGVALGDAVWKYVLG